MALESTASSRTRKRQLQRGESTQVCTDPDWLYKFRNGKKNIFTTQDRCLQFTDFLEKKLIHLY